MDSLICRCGRMWRCSVTIAWNTRSATWSAEIRPDLTACRSCSSRSRSTDDFALSSRKSAGRLRSESEIPVGTNAGQSTEALILAPNSIKSWCRHSVSATTECLDTQYMAMPGGDSRPATDAVLTTWPSTFCSSMRGTNTRMPWMTPQTFTPKVHSQSFSDCSQTVPPGATPALLQRTCTPPNALKALSASASTSRPLDTSVRTASTV